MSRDHDATRARSAPRRALWIALLANAGFLVVEVVAGFVFDSLALLADAAHMGSDVVALGIALVAAALVTRPSSARHSYGWRRAEALGAQANAVILFAVAVWILVEAGQRLDEPASVDGTGLLVVATLGLLVNVGCAILLARAQSGVVRGKDLNLHGAFLHLVADAAGSAAAMVAGVAVLAFGADWVDPAVSILVGLLVIVSAWRLLRQTTHVLLEGAPPGIDPEAVEAALVGGPGVESVHHLHLWELASDTPALSAHVVLTGDPSLHEAQARGEVLKARLAQRFSIVHATLELECHGCEQPEHDGADSAGRAV
jgi:cobalt-zinc-cadmium efflux system protein